VSGVRVPPQASRFAGILWRCLPIGNYFAGVRVDIPGASDHPLAPNVVHTEELSGCPDVRLFGATPSLGPWPRSTEKFVQR
jgi:hypothetical protein